MKPFNIFSSHKFLAVLFFTGMTFAFSAPAWAKSDGTYPPYPIQVYRNPSPSPGVEVSRRQQAPPQMDEDTQRNWKTYQGLSPDDKAGLRDKSQRWQSLPPDQQNEMRRRMERYRELPPQDQERYQQRYQQWQSLPSEDRNRIRDRLKNWDSLSPQEQEDVLQRFPRR
jgi:predicted Fe-S protein YdhL (DUF1289 family)